MRTRTALAAAALTAVTILGGAATAIADPVPNPDLSEAVTKIPEIPATWCGSTNDSLIAIPCSGGKTLFD